VFTGIVREVGRVVALEGGTDDGAVLVDLTAELELDVEPEVDLTGAADLRWPPAPPSAFP